MGKALSILLIVAIVATLGWIVYIAVTPEKSDRLTSEKLPEELAEFYILDAEGKVNEYQTQVSLGEPVNVVVGIVNHEYQSASYSVRIIINGFESKEVDIGTLAHGSKWEEQISFTPQVPGDAQEVNFYLYKNGGDKPYLREPLTVYVDVTIPFR